MIKTAVKEAYVDIDWFSKLSKKLHSFSFTYKIPDKLSRNYNQLLQNIKLVHSIKGYQIFAITSSVRYEGTSTIACILSLLLSQTMNDKNKEKEKNYDNDSNDKRQGVLIIDGNINNPMLHRLLGVDRQVGLSEINFKIDTDSASSKRHKLHVITSCTNKDYWQNIFEPDKFKLLLSELRKKFEYILVDLPPVIGHPTTRTLSQLTDGTLFVIKGNHTRIEVIKEAKQQLQNAEVNILGAVLNERKYFIPKFLYKKL